MARSERAAVGRLDPPVVTVRVAYIGNFGPTHSTENHIARAIRTLGHTLDAFQENDPGVWSQGLARSEADVLLWTHTGGFPPVDNADQHRVIDEWRVRNRAPVVGVHLDRWWGLPREQQITVERRAFFHAPDVLATADGGHDDLWAGEGINHWWFPPGVSEPECAPAAPHPMFQSDVAFVGSWQGGYHPEWDHRRQLVEWLQESRFQVRFWPQGRPVRGRALRQLYASTRVVVGDSCLVPNTDGSPARAYCSDRVPETLGRGGNLVHPFVEWITDGGMYTAGEHLHVWELGDWAGLEQTITEALDTHRGHRGRQHTLASHTYEIRMRDLLALVVPDA